MQYFEPLVQGTIGAASNLNNSKQQEQILDQVKSVTESALQLIYSTKDGGGNPKVSNNFCYDFISSAEFFDSKLPDHNLKECLDIQRIGSSIINIHYIFIHELEQ